MLQSKDIKNLSELTTSFCSTHRKVEFFREFIKILRLGKLHSIFSKVKQKGIPALCLIEILICSVFTGQKNVHRLVGSFWGELASYGKDAYYRIKGNGRIYWRQFLFGVARQAVEKTQDGKCQSDTTALIFDDTVLEKSGRTIEGVSKIWDHVIGRSVLGYQLLVMGYYNGGVFIPLDFSFHRRGMKNKKKPYGLKLKHYKDQYRKERAKDSPGQERKKELDTDKITAAAKMIQTAVKKGFAAQYVLTDSWFTCWKMVHAAKKAGLHYIGMFCKVKTLFKYRGKNMTYKAIRNLNRKNTKRNKCFGLYYIRTVVEWNGEFTVLYFTRRGKHGKWKVVLSTDTKSTFKSTIEIYQIRWSIEVFFKESKQLLGLGKEQSTDFDAQVAHTTLVMVQHIFLTLKNQMQQYETLGRLFEGTQAETLELRLHERLIALLLSLVELIDQLLEGLDAQEIVRKAINSLDAFEKIKLLLSPPAMHNNIAEPKPILEQPLTISQISNG